MAVKIKGVEEILKNIEAKLGESRTNRVVNKVLREVGEDAKKIVEDAVSTYQMTGETYDTVIVSAVKNKPEKHISIGWGSGSRWRLVHLNEFGYIRKGRIKTPRGIGKLRGAIDKIEDTALPKIREGLEELTK